LRRWLVALAVTLSVVAVGFGWWVAHPLRVSFGLLPADACPVVTSPCTPITYRVFNHGFAHVYVNCDVRVLASDGRVLARGALSFPEVPIGPVFQPWSTTLGAAWIDAPPPREAARVDGSCSPIYVHGEPPV
jgi:hypothetical protein